MGGQPLVWSDGGGGHDVFSERRPATQGSYTSVGKGHHDADPALVARFDELVPVLYGDLAGAELCHYFLDPAAARILVDFHTACRRAAERRSVLD